MHNFLLIFCSNLVSFTTHCHILILLENRIAFSCPVCL